MAIDKIKFKGLLSATAVAGLVMGGASIDFAKAAGSLDGKLFAGKGKEHGGKDGCKGKDSCKGEKHKMDKDSHKGKKHKKDKNACAGKDGCGEK